MQFTEATPDDHWFIIHENNLLLLNETKQKVPQTHHIQELLAKLTHMHRMGSYNHHPCVCAELPGTEAPPANLISLSLRKALDILGMEWYYAAARAYAIINWDLNHQYCGHCSHLTVHKPGMFERVCTHCGLSFYPRISPSVIVMIYRGNEILMARSPHFTPGAYGLIAGFVEAGESLEEAVHREVKEEVSIQITNLRYFASQPWPFPDSLMVGFLADYAAGEIHIDSREIEAAGWYSYDNLPGKPASTVSLSRKLIEHFLAEQRALRKPL